MAASKNVKKSQGLPDHVIGLLSAADQRNGLPPGTMYSVMQQEIGGQTDRFMADPTAYHYAANDKGQRIAAHTGKISTAFGPFGILESTGRDPGYGVAPLKDKTLEEQVRFASDYLAARSKKGGLTAGLAGYGEGEKYAAQVTARMGGKPSDIGRTVPVAPVMVAENSNYVGAGVDLAPTPMLEPQLPAPVQLAQAPTQVMPQGPDAWQQFLEQSRQPQGQPVQVADLNYGGPPQAPQLHIPDFMSTVNQGQNRPNFQMLKALKGWA